MTKVRLNLKNVIAIAICFAGITVFSSCDKPEKDSTEKPNAVMNFTAAAGSEQVSLSWNAPSDNGGSEITGYEVTMDNWANKVTKMASEQTHTYTGLTNGILYTFKVRAVNANGSGEAAMATATPINQGILINGVRWATCNVGSKGTFVTKPEDYGKYYTWTEAKNVCPNGWRLPTKSEIESLVNATYVTSEWTTLNDIKGRRFTDKTTGNNIFLPAAGFYHPAYDEMRAVGEYGMYWSSTEAGSDTAYDLWCMSNFAILANSGYGYGIFVRCVSNN